MIQMSILLLLIPLALILGIIALAAFMWALKNNQFDDPKGNSERILIEEDE